MWHSWTYSHHRSFDGVLVTTKCISHSGICLVGSICLLGQFVVVAHCEADVFIEALAVAAARKPAVLAHAVSVLFIETVGINPTNGGIE